MSSYDLGINNLTAYLNQLGLKELNANSKPAQQQSVQSSSVPHGGKCKPCKGTCPLHAKKVK